MSILVQSKIFTVLLRLLLILFVFFLVFISFQLLLALSRPSHYISAHQSVTQGPGKSVDLQKMRTLDIHQYLYLDGPVLSVANNRSQALLFATGRSSLAGASLFMDRWGAVEVVCQNTPYTLSDLSAFHYREPLHMLGWREKAATFSIIALAKSKADLLQLLDSKAQHWKTTFFIQSLILALAVFGILGLLTFLILQKFLLHWFFVLVANSTFGLLLFSVSILSAYPLLSLWVQILGVFVLSNLLFFSLPFGIIWLKKLRKQGGI